MGRLGALCLRMLVGEDDRLPNKHWPDMHDVGDHDKAVREQAFKTMSTSAGGAFQALSHGLWVASEDGATPEVVTIVNEQAHPFWQSFNYRLVITPQRVKLIFVWRLRRRSPVVLQIAFGYA